MQDSTRFSIFPDEGTINRNEMLLNLRGNLLYYNSYVQLFQGREPIDKYLSKISGASHFTWSIFPHDVLKTHCEGLRSQRKYVSYSITVPLVTSPTSNSFFMIQAKLYLI